MRHLYFCPKCYQVVITKTEIPPDMPNVVCTCSATSAIDVCTFPENWSDDQCCEFYNNQMADAMERGIINGATFFGMNPVGMPRTESQQAGMFRTSDGAAISVTQGNKKLISEG